MLWLYVYNDNILLSPCDVDHAKEFFLFSVIASCLAAPRRLAPFHYLPWPLSLGVCEGKKESKEADSPSSTWQGDVAKTWRQAQRLAERQPHRGGVRDREGGVTFIFFIWEKAFRRAEGKKKNSFETKTCILGPMFQYIRNSLKNTPKKSLKLPFKRTSKGCGFLAGYLSRLIGMLMSAAWVAVVAVTLLQLP